ncbi:putative Permease of the major facilitator superfamily [Bradyrhizobium oligotrophicum S58]|uniref:Putative Permease of the major facilitator superfamily n=1 Tax=Bradyrhizobium oligotrophicum S58 TaxID=1245469 RepID=M4ZGR8_9BRAD|nr:MFS transporter [Bradyrhizobium oligotrophicum]BAM92731.1 putative Permease of the major facilitator superfamily [Bradyrhizobium oligotrophicum S58]
MIDAKRVAAPAAPLWPAVAAMTALQALVSLALFAPGTIAPRAGISIEQLSLFSTAAFAISLVSSFWGGTLVQKVGSLRVAALCAVAVCAGMSLATLGYGWALLGAGLTLGLAAGPETPASSALLGRLVPPEKRAMVFSIRQTGSQIGAVMGSLLLPPLAVGLAPSSAYAAVIVCAVIGFVSFERLRPAYAVTTQVMPNLGLRQRLQLVSTDGRMAALAIASIPFSGMQVILNTCFVSFGTAELGLSHVEAGWVLASAQGAGLMGRLGWGVVATRLRSAHAVLVMAGAGMAACALLLGLWGPLLSRPILVLLTVVFGLTASGWNGVFIAEIANLAKPERVAEATGAVLTASFLGLVAAPLLVAVLTPRFGLGGSFVALALLSAAGAAVLLMERVHARE